MQIDKEELLADNEEGQQRFREAVERKEHWLAGQVENEDKKTVLTKTVVSADTEGGNAATATDEAENVEHVKKSVRDAILGKGDEKIERGMDTSVANGPAEYGIGTPGRNIDMEDEVGIEDGAARSSDLRVSTPEQNPQQASTRH